MSSSPRLARSAPIALSLLATLVSLSGCDCGSMPIPADTGPRSDAGSSEDAPGLDAPFVFLDSPLPDPDAGPTCATTMCGPGERCEIVAGAAACVPNTCAELACSPTERCVPATTGMGNVCVDVACTDSIDCPAEEFCNGLVCLPDVCVPGTATCEGMSVAVCRDDGGGMPSSFTCGSEAHFTSACTDDGSGAYCPCEGDWDCPADTVCELGRCTGTGRPPTCSLPPTPFTSVLPVNEITWGGTGPGALVPAVGSPFPTSAQVDVTPVVANLDDDNGDGRIDELDIPEIVFESWCGTDVSSNGVLRAIHGGGPARGRDFFAVQGLTVWHEGDPMPTENCVFGSVNSSAGLAVGDLDGDGVPEIVAIDENRGVQIHSNTGENIALTTSSLWPTTGHANPAPVIANLDHRGPPEIVVGNHVLTLRITPGMPIAFEDHFQGTLRTGTGGQGPIPCVANLVGPDEDEVIAGSSVYRMPTPPAGVTRRADCAVGDTSTFCTGGLDVVWDGQTVNGTTMLPNANRDGFCAIADVLGADEAAAPSPTNPLDGTPEVVLIANGYLVILSGEDGVLRRFTNLGVGSNGGAPNVDDFDGDGFPEIGTAFGLRYVAIDLQETSAACPAWPNAFNDAATGLQGNPARYTPTACAADADCTTAGTTCNETVGQCVCLHNGWMRVTEDDSSRVTGSTVFDFNGDGAAELIYNDECNFRIYDGRDGTVLFKEPSSSRTRIENPVVADVDNDGNAEIVFSSNNDAPGACSAGATNNGIEVWGDASDTWVSARRVWNQHAYAVTNVTESAAIPTHAAESWLSYGRRQYNTFRSQPRSFGVAPDLVPDRVQASSPDAVCGTLGTTLEITVRVVNQGDLRVGPDVPVRFYGEWTSPSVMEPLHADAAMTPLEAVLGVTLEPRRSALVTVRYDAANNSPGVLPDRIRVSIDDGDTARECIETNNDLAIDVDPGSLAPDLAITLGAVSGTCPAQVFAVTVENVGSAPTTDPLVRLYAGDPSAGGTPIFEQTVSGVLAPGASTMLSITVDPFPLDAEITVWGVVDPDDTIDECADGNNRDPADGIAFCTGLM
jgi:hypothetical protein